MTIDVSSKVRIGIVACAVLWLLAIVYVAAGGGESQSSNGETAPPTTPTPAPTSAPPPQKPIRSAQELRGPPSPPVACKEELVRLFDALRTEPILELNFHGDPSGERLRDAFLEQMAYLYQASSHPISVRTTEVSADAPSELSILLKRVGRMLPLDPQERDEHSFPLDPQLKTSILPELVDAFRYLVDYESETPVKIGWHTGFAEGVSDEGVTKALNGRRGTVRGMIAGWDWAVVTELYSVDTARGALAVPKVDVLIVDQPKRVLSPPEIAKLDDYLMEGGHTVIVAASAFWPTDDGPRVVPTGALGEWVRGYGLEIVEDGILDPDGGAFCERGADSGLSCVPEVLIAHATPAPLGDIPASFRTLARLDKVSFPFASELRVFPEAQPNATVWVAATSGDRATTHSGADRRPHARGIAAVAEGRLRSADGREADGRLIVLSSSSMFSQPFDALPKTGESEKHANGYAIYMDRLVDVLPKMLHDLKLYKHCEL